MKSIAKIFSFVAIFLLACDEPTTTRTAQQEPNEAERALTVNGFKDITITSTNIFTPDWDGCGKDDGVAYHAIATNPAGQRVSVIVCCGGPLSFKGCVIRSN